MRSARRARAFLGYSATGALLWGGAGIALGAIFHDSVDRVLLTLETMGSAALMVLGGLLALFIAYKYVERRRHRATLAIPRIVVEELQEPDGRRGRIRSSSTRAASPPRSWKRRFPARCCTATANRAS